jgi:hypothetical protein
MPSRLARCMKYSAPLHTASFIGTAGATHPLHVRGCSLLSKRLTCALRCIRELNARPHRRNFNKLGIKRVFRFLGNVPSRRASSRQPGCAQQRLHVPRATHIKAYVCAIAVSRRKVQFCPLLQVPTRLCGDSRDLNSLTASLRLQ